MRTLATITCLAFPGALQAAPYYSVPDAEGLLWNATEILIEENGDMSIWMEIDATGGPLYAWAEVRCAEPPIALIGPAADKQAVSKGHLAAAMGESFEFHAPQDSREVVWRIAAAACKREGFDFPLVGGQ